MTMVFLKACHYCTAELRGFDYTSRFTAWGWHLRTFHFKSWGRGVAR